MNAERSAGLVRRWVALYTRGLPPDAREERRDEIDGDLWSQVHEESQVQRADASLGGEIFVRLLLGMPADLTWRLEQRPAASDRRPPARGPNLHTRPVSFPAIFGGICWTIWPIPSALLGDAAWADPMMGWLMFVTVVFGTWALAGAVVGLVIAFQDAIRGPVAAIGVVTASVAAVSVLGPYGLVVMLPVGAGLVPWELWRTGALGPWLAWTHIAAALLTVAFILLAIVRASFVSPGSIVAVLLIPPLMAYGLSWVAIGWAMFHRPRPADESATGS
jgi:hypothetical protein